jgi:hypothetical protein
VTVLRRPHVDLDASAVLSERTRRARDDDAERERLEQRLRELDAEIHVERELEAYRLHRRLRSSGICVDLEALRPLRVPRAAPPSTPVAEPRVLRRPFGTVLRVR